MAAPAYAILRARVTTSSFAGAADRSAYLVESIRSDDAGVLKGAPLRFANETARLKRTESGTSLRSQASSISADGDATAPATAPTASSESAWRTLADFRALHTSLRAELGPRVFTIPFPTLSRWYRSLIASAEDAAELRRSLLENYLECALLLPGVAASSSLRAFVRQADRPDWPASVGAIDLGVHDLPHESSATEWWYFNTHFKDGAGNDYSAFAAFFRVVKHTDKVTGKKSYAHALNWALTDVTNKRYVHESVLDKDSPAVVRKQLDSGIVKDSRLKRAYLEILDKGNVPLPDRMFSKGRDAVVGTGSALSLDFESAKLTKNASGSYVLTCTTPNGKTGVELVLNPQKPPVRHGLDGVVKGHDSDDMFYYCIPRCGLTGHFTLDGVRKPIASGAGWYDHEFGGVPQEETGTPGMNYAWNWAAIQLDNGFDVSVATLVDPRSKPYRVMESRAIVIDGAGGRTQPNDLEFEEGEQWTSVRTFNTYAVSWRVALPSAGIELTLTAPFPDQEFVTLIAKPGFWEGRLDVIGTHNGKPVKGLAYVERNGFSTLSELDSFFKAVGVQTRKAVAEVYPNVVDEKTAVNLIATPETAHIVEGVDFAVFREGIIAPVRYISDMGGKSWRSYGALACMDVVGGDSRKFVRWLSMPEFMHVGSLIVDDIEDGSTKRRGVDCAHMKFGEAISINAGTAAYFQGQQMLLVPGLTPEQLNKVYDFYFAALRAGHAGQALDIAGLGYLMDDVIERGDGDLAESRIIAVHRLKTAVPAASLARMGALVGGGTPEQIEAVGQYYEAIGIAFQIMDDVLNLRGIYSGSADNSSGVELKNLGEDISAGKVTIPVVKALRRLPKDRMRSLWEVVKSKPTERSVVDGVIAELEECGAIDECVEHSERLVEEAFAKLDAIIPDSFSKLMLRAFGWFVTEQSATRSVQVAARAARAAALAAKA